MGFFLGVDAGNTKTIALVAKDDGTIIGSGRGGNGDIYGAGSPEVALANVQHAVRSAMGGAGVRPDDIVAGAFSMAGADWPEDFALLSSAMNEEGLGRRITIVNDAIGGLYAGSPTGFGVSMVIGTGAAIGSRSPHGTIWHASFWLTDEHPYKMAYETLKAAYFHDLGIAPPTNLTERLVQLFGVTSVEDMLHGLTGRENSTHLPTSRVLQVLFDEAERQDEVSRQIVKRFGQVYGDYGVVAARKVGIENHEFPLVFAGGTLRHPSPFLYDTIVRRVQERCPGAQPVRSEREPAIGVLCLAFQAGEAPITGGVVQRLTDTAPEASFFATLTEAV